MNNRMLFITEHIRRRRRLITYKWRHSDVIIIKLTAFIQNEIPYKTYISDFFCIWKITEFMPACLRGAVFLDTVYNPCHNAFGRLERCRYLQALNLLRDSVLCRWTVLRCITLLARVVAVLTFDLTAGCLQCRRSSVLHLLIPAVYVMWYALSFVGSRIIFCHFFLTVTFVYL